MGATPKNPLSLPAPNVPPALMSVVKAVFEVYLEDPATVPEAAVAAMVIHGPPLGYKPILALVPAAKLAFSSAGLFH